jgi:hypothetical protein
MSWLYLARYLFLLALIALIATLLWAARRTDGR